MGTSELVPVALPHWPVTTKSLSWSTDGLAVGAGETVHILTPKRDDKRKTSGVRSAGAPHDGWKSQWHLSSVQVNTFDIAEWPAQTLATIKHFSIGEEQSNSHVTCVKWSYEGLGMHSRTVLGVLTANLLLSMWETDGKLDQWKRTGIINHHLGETNVVKVSADAEAKSIGSERRKTRIRAFCWLPPIDARNRKDPMHRLLKHLLVIADDNANLHVLEISKRNKGAFGEWEVEKLLLSSLPRSLPTGVVAEKLSPLQRKLYEQSTVDDVSCSGAWQPSEPLVSGAHVLSTELQCTTRQVRHTLKIHATVDDHGVVHLQSREPHSKQLEYSILPELFSSQGRGGDVDRAGEYFTSSLYQVRLEYSKKHQLGNSVRSRCWGVALSPDAQQYAGCFTLHPSTMIEHSSPKTENCVVLFRRHVDYIPDLGPSKLSTKEVGDGVISFVTDWILASTSKLQVLDRKVLNVVNALACTAGAQAELRDRLVTASSKFLTSRPALIPDRAEPSQQVLASSGTSDIPSPESCEICDAGIPFSRNISMASCHRGHQFTRCNLTFLAIQEPGISKYCSVCGKQFLDLVKFGAPEGPSLVQALFSKFDRCPYCLAKFRA